MSHKRETLQELVLLKENSNRNYVSFHHLEQAPKQLRKFVYLTTVVSTQKHNIQWSLCLHSFQRKMPLYRIIKIELDIQNMMQNKEAIKYHLKANH